VGPWQQAHVLLHQELLPMGWGSLLLVLLLLLVVLLMPLLWG
jgi:hypothetical protein